MISQAQIDVTVVIFMRRFGGSFVKALADAYEKADLDNRARIRNAFPELYERYARMGGAL